MVALNLTDRIHAAAIRNIQDDVPEEGPSRPIIRLGVILVGAYDQPDGVDEVEFDPELPVVDLLTDVMHWCANEGIDFDVVVENAHHMHQVEREEWGQ